ncbi:MAG: LacI family DNA-binding transcriptional regulator [Chloroflexota bacterium]
MKQKITIDDVARAAGVSKQTVSRAINNKGEISPKTRDRILKLIKEMGYRPNRMAQAMNTSRSHMIGLVINDITNPFFPELVRAVQDAAMQKGYTALICNIDEDKEIEILHELVTHGIDGLITFTHQASEAAIAEFADSFGPLLIINREFDQLIDHSNVTSLVVDNFHGAQQAVNHLVELGHEKIGMLTNKYFPKEKTRRVQGYQHALADNGLESEQSLLVEHDPTLAGGYEATKMLLAERPDVTGIFTYNDLMGLGAIRACRDLNLAVPQDISVIGFDNIQIASMVTPAMSSIHVDKYEMGRLAFERIFELIQDESKNTKTIRMQTELVDRESTGRVPMQVAQSSSH